MLTIMIGDVIRLSYAKKHGKIFVKTMLQCCRVMGDNIDFGAKVSHAVLRYVNIRLFWFSCSRDKNLLNINEMNIHDRREDHVPLFLIQKQFWKFLSHPYPEMALSVYGFSDFWYFLFFHQTFRFESLWKIYFGKSMALRIFIPIS